MFAVRERKKEESVVKKEDVVIVEVESSVETD